MLVHISNEQLTLVYCLISEAHTDEVGIYSSWIYQDSISQDVVVCRHAAQHGTLVALHMSGLHLGKTSMKVQSTSIKCLASGTFWILFQLRERHRRQVHLHFAFQDCWCEPPNQTFLFFSDAIFVSTNFLKAIIEGAAATLSLWFSLLYLQDISWISTMMSSYWSWPFSHLGYIPI